MQLGHAHAETATYSIHCWTNIPQTQCHPLCGEAHVPRTAALLLCSCCMMLELAASVLAADAGCKAPTKVIFFDIIFVKKLVTGDIIKYILRNIKNSI